jgi:hypothetical protein
MIMVGARGGYPQGYAKRRRCVAAGLAEGRPGKRGGRSTPYQLGYIEDHGEQRQEPREYQSHEGARYAPEDQAEQRV